MNKATTSPVYTVGEVAQILKISVYSVRELLKNGDIHGFKVGTKWRITQESLDEIMKKE